MPLKRYNLSDKKRPEILKDVPLLRSNNTYSKKKLRESHFGCKSLIISDDIH